MIFMDGGATASVEMMETTAQKYSIVMRKPGIPDFDIEFLRLECQSGHLALLMSGRRSGLGDVTDHLGFADGFDHVLNLSRGGTKEGSQ